MQRVSLQECVIYEPGVSTSPILLHNVPIRDSRHCGSVHHLAPATSTPGERETGTERGTKERKKEGGSTVHYPAINYHPCAFTEAVTNCMHVQQGRGKKEIKNKNDDKK